MRERKKKRTILGKQIEKCHTRVLEEKSDKRQLDFKKSVFVLFLLERGDRRRRRRVQEALEKRGRSEKARAADARKNVLQVEVDVSDNDAKDVGENAAAHQRAERDEHKGQIRRGKDKEAEEAHAHKAVSARPHVHNHERQRGPKKGQRPARGRGACVEERSVEQQQRTRAKEPHPHKVRAAPAKAGLFEACAVPQEEKHVEEPPQRKAAVEEEEVCEQPPRIAPHPRKVQKELHGARRPHRRRKRRRNARPEKRLCHWRLSMIHQNFHAAACLAARALSAFRFFCHVSST